MNSPFVGAGSLKLGFKSTVPSSNSNVMQPALSKISPLPIYRGNFLNPTRKRESLRSKGYKFFAKLPAGGPETFKILQDIKKSHSIKFIQYFEFDPYLCDSSHLSDLKKVCNKIKGIKRLNLVIRRVDNLVELGELGPFIARFTRLTSVRIEFPTTQNITEDALIKFYFGLGNCAFIKSIETVDVNIPERSENCANAAAKALRKLKWMEDVKNYVSFRKGNLRNEVEKKSKPPRRTESSKLKNFEITLSLPGEWSNMGEDNNGFDPKIGITMLQQIPLIQRMKVRTIRIPPKYEDTVNVFTAMSCLPALREVEVEYLNCQLTDLDIIAYAQGLSNMKQLEYFCLKILQNPNISEECIERFAVIVSKLENLTSFDFYFRRLSLPPQGILELGKRIQSSANVQCSCSKESIHIYKKK